MHNIFTWIRRLLREVATANRIDPDPVSTMSPRDLADLPVWHPCHDDGAATGSLRSR